MQALTLKHPWPWAIARLGKRIENRTWRAAMASGTWYAIHGGVVPRGAELQRASLMAIDLARRFQAQRFESAFLPGIVALARHGGYITASDDPWFEGPVGWVISDLIVLPAPIQIKGAQGLWSVPKEFEAYLLKLIAEERG